MLTIKQANIEDLKDLVPLFDQYRIFYGKTSNYLAASKFLTERIVNKESTIFLAYWKQKPVGFTQLYYTFSSVTLEKSLILNDLFVEISFRNKKVGKELLKMAQEYCINNGYKGLALETATDNKAQFLYESLGWVKDMECFHYFWLAK